MIQPIVVIIILWVVHYNSMLIIKPIVVKLLPSFVDKLHKYIDRKKTLLY